MANGDNQVNSPLVQRLGVIGLFLLGIMGGALGDRILVEGRIAGVEASIIAIQRDVSRMESRMETMSVRMDELARQWQSYRQRGS